MDDFIQLGHQEFFERLGYFKDRLFSEIEGEAVIFYRDGGTVETGPSLRRIAVINGKGCYMHPERVKESEPLVRRKMISA